MRVHRLDLTKPDGRRLWLYSREPIDPSIEAVAPAGAVEPNPHLRFHPLRGEWVVYANHRQTRTFLPPKDYNPLAPSRDRENPTEVPVGAYDVAVFENRFPSLCEGAHKPPKELVATAPARGSCEVVVFTQDANASLGSLPLSHLELIVRVWADRTRELGAREDVSYVFPFENRGVEVGVTLSHPHGQIYAYPFVPPIPARELERQLHHYKAHGTSLVEMILNEERAAQTRIVVDNGLTLSFVPSFARYAYEVWIAPLRVARTLADLNDAEIASFARTLKTTLLKLDRLFDKPMPYVMAFHQAPTDGKPHPEAHLHVEIYPALRMPTRLKYLAGSELGAGTFTADTLPEEKAAELRVVEVA